VDRDSTNEERRDVALLWRRAGFGATPAELDRSVEQGWDATVAELCDTSAADPAAGAVTPPTFDTERILSSLAAAKDDKAAKKAGRQVARQESQQLMLWWLRRMVAAERPLREKLTWFWHGHFATSVQKVRLAELMYGQNQSFRRLGTGDFEALAQALVIDPAMLLWLDGNKSSKADPNENLARELLELFLLGHGHHAHQPYTEDDVKAAARALTGWRLDRTMTVTASFAANRHDGDSKTFLGETGRWGASDIVRIAVADDASAPFVVSRLCSRLVRPVEVDDPMVVDLAAGFGRDHDVSALCRRMFAHDGFRSAATRTGLVKQPVDWVVGAHRSLGLVPNAALLKPLQMLGQVPFLPPSVGGWPEGRAWLSTGAAEVRLRLARELAARADLSQVSSVSPAARPDATARLLGIDRWGPSSSAALSKAADDPTTLVTLALVAPEHLLA